MNINGLTKDDLNAFSDLLKKANNEQMTMLSMRLQQEFYRRT